MAIPKLEFKIAENEDFIDIQSLLEANHKANLTVEQRQQNGFVTYRPTMEELAKVNGELGIIVAREGIALAGYLIPMTKRYATNDPFFRELISRISEITFEGRRIVDRNYMVFAQICVDKEYHGQGVPTKFYDFIDSVYGSNFDIAIAEIDDRNKVSLNSSKGAGFVDCGTYDSNGIRWHVVVKKLKKGGRK